MDGLRFNAFAIHGHGSADPDEAHMHYESLFPVDPSVLDKPDFHHLDAFEPIDLSSIGYEIETELPDIWAAAKSNAQNFEFE